MQDISDSQNLTSDAFNAFMHASSQHHEPPASPPLPDDAVDCILQGGWGSTLKQGTNDGDSNETEKHCRVLFLSLVACPTRTQDFSANAFKMNMIASLVSSAVVAHFSVPKAASLLDMLGKVAITASRCNSQLPTELRGSNVPKITFSVDATSLAESDRTLLDTEDTVSPVTALLRHVVPPSDMSLADLHTTTARINSYFEHDEGGVLSAIATSIDMTTPPSLSVDLAQFSDHIRPTSVQDLYRSLTTSLQSHHHKDPQKEDTDTPQSPSFLQVVSPLLRMYISAVTACEVEDSSSAAITAVISENDDWGGVEVAWEEGVPSSQLEDSLTHSSHTMVSVDLCASSGRGVPPNCMTAYRAVMTAQLLDPSTASAQVSLAGDGYIDTPLGADQQGKYPPIR